MAHCSYCGANTTNPCRTDEEARRCRALKRLSARVLVLTLTLMFLPIMLGAQVRTYKFTRFIETECMTRDIEQATTVVEHTDHIAFIVKGGKTTVYHIVTYGTPLYGEHGTEYKFNCTDQSGESVVISLHPVLSYVMKTGDRRHALIYMTDKSRVVIQN